MADRKRVTRLVSEAVVITASILLAFALDAWWDASRERQRGEALISALSAEFDAVERELQRARGVHERRIAAATALIELAATSAPLPDADSLATLMESARAPTTIDPPGTVLNGATGAGALAFIEDDSLRVLLAGWSGRVADHQKTEENIRGYVFGTFIPWLAERGLHPPITGATDRWGSRVEAAMQDPGLSGHLWMMQRHGVLRTESDNLMEVAGEITRLLRTETR